MSLLGGNRPQHPSTFDPNQQKDKYLNYWRELCECGHTRGMHGPAGATMHDGACCSVYHRVHGMIMEECNAFRSTGKLKELITA